MHHAVNSSVAPTKKNRKASIYYCLHPFARLLLSDLFWGGPINAAEKVPRLETPEMPNTGAKVIYLPNLVMTNIAMRNGP
jgi:hypothetical protein